jgi:RNA polymerase sigma-70 factor (ECF subfamily)
VTEETTYQALVQGARRGEAAAVEALVRRSLRPAYAVALSVLRHVADAEDVAHEAILVALRRLDQCREPERFLAWLLQSVRHRALRFAADGRSRAALHARVEPGEPAALDPTAVLVRRRLLAALEHLSPVQREVVLLHDLESWTHGEIAGALECSEVASRQHLFQARRRLRERLGEACDEGGRDGFRLG